MVIARYCSDKNESPSQFEDGNLRCESVEDWIDNYADCEGISGSVMEYVKFHRIIDDMSPSLFVKMKNPDEVLTFQEWADKLGESYYTMLKRVCKAPAWFDGVYIVYE